MDLLEYQGKQLFARRGVPVPEGTPATTVEEAVAATAGASGAIAAGAIASAASCAALAPARRAR